ncbi:nephrin-like [Oppia nitens]|uniref:nephrin-like n=1 Tax=Oppia nitens TaxID=1686743 RepID=UPI0023D9DBB0|nr:nephrin-like [Oppia nitens]
MLSKAIADLSNVFESSFTPEFIKSNYSLYKIVNLVIILILLNEPAFVPRFNTYVSAAYQQFFRVRPQHQEVVENSEVLLQCQVANQAGLVQWSKDGFLLGFDADIPGWPRYSMSVDTQRGVYNLKIQNILLSDEGDIECQVGPTKDNKAIRANSRITVLVPPHEISLLSINRPFVSNTTKQSKSQPNNRLKVREAERIGLLCNTTTLSKPPTLLKWFRNGVPLSKDISTTILSEGLGTSGKLTSTSSVIYIYTKLDDNGVQYSCQGEHPALTKPIKSTITLSVLYPPGLPSIEGYTDGDVIRVTDTLTLACISRGGNPLAKLIWYKDSEEVDNTYSGSGGRESTNIYTFIVSPSDNNAVYKCEATNDVTAQPLIALIQLKVLFPAVKVDINGPKQGKVGDVLTQTCIAGPANPKTELTWVIDGHTVLPLEMWFIETREGWLTASNVSFTLTSADPNTKTISCYSVSESIGETIVQTINIDILYPPGVPYIIGFKEGTALESGELYRFKCVSMGGNPLPTLRWQVINANSDTNSDRQISALTSISGSGVSSELVIRAEPADNGASYRCETSNTATSRPLSALIKLSVHYITDSVNIELKTKHVKSGDVLNLLCDSGPCNPLCQLFWYRNGLQIDGTENKLTETNVPFGGKTTQSELRLDVTTRDDNTVIACEAVNQVISKRSITNITLSVLFRPQFLVPPLQKYDVIEGADISVNLTARGNPSLISYIWSKDSLPLFDISETTTLSNVVIIEKQHQRRQHQLLSYGPILTIKNILREDAAEYDCEATNSEGTTKTSILINVFFAPIIVDISKTVITDSGESAQLYCLCVANPMSDELIVWKREGNTNFLKDDRINVHNERGKSVLSISNVNADTDSGVYECWANNGIGEKAIERIVLLIKNKPEIVSNMTTVNVAAEASESVRMVCTASGVPTVHFKWLGADNEILTTESELLVNNNVKYFRYALQRKQISDTLFQSSLTIKSLTDSELNKSFECIANNDKGETQIVIKLRKRGKPDPPSDVRLVNITHNSAFLSWTPTFDGGIDQSFRVKYSAIGTTNFETKETNKNWIVIKGLDSDSKYYFVVIAFNVIGNSDESNNTIYATTYGSEFDSSEPLIDSYFKQKSDLSSKSFSIIIIIVLFAGFILIILNVGLLLCYYKWKKQVQSRHKDNNNQTSSAGNKNHANLYKDVVNGEATLMKGLTHESTDMTDMTSALIPIDKQLTYIESTDNGDHCQVLLLNDINSSSSSSLQQPLSHVLLRNCQNSHKNKDLSLEASDCPDIIKNPNIESYEMETIVDENYSTLSQKQLNNYCNHMNTSNTLVNDSVVYIQNNSIKIQSNSDSFKLKSILKNGNLKSRPTHDIHML